MGIINHFVKQEHTNHKIHPIRIASGWGSAHFFCVRHLLIAIGNDLPRLLKPIVIKNINWFVACEFCGFGWFPG